MSNVTGVVQEIATRSVAGGKTAYNVVVAGQAYGAGLYAPKCKQGDYVTFEVDESRGYKNVARGTLRVSANKPPAEAVAEAAATAPRTNSAGGSFDNRQDVISRQAALNSAIAAFGAIAQADAAGLPKTDTKGKRLEAALTIIEELRSRFYEDSTGLEWKDISPSKKGETSVEDQDGTGPDDIPWD